MRHAGQNADICDGDLFFWMQLLDEKDRDRILGPHKKVQQWIESTRNATRPHFDEVHSVLYKLKMKLSAQQAGIKAPLTSKMWPIKTMPVAYL